MDQNRAPIAPVQLEHLHARSVSPAERREAILDSFARFLGGALRKGWGLGIHWQTDVIGDLSSWHVTWGQGDDLDAFEQEVFRMNPDPGWIPRDSEDPPFFKRPPDECGQNNEGSAECGLESGDVPARLHKDRTSSLGPFARNLEGWGFAKYWARMRSPR